MLLLDHWVSGGSTYQAMPLEVSYVVTPHLESMALTASRASDPLVSRSWSSLLVEVGLPPDRVEYLMTERHRSRQPA